MSAQALPVREALPGVDPVVDARFMLAHPEVAHSPQHYREILAGLLGQRTELLKVLDQVANGHHLDDVPNHSDDDLRTIAERLPPSEAWARKELLAHAARVDDAITKVTGGAL